MYDNYDYSDIASAVEKYLKLRELELKVLSLSICWNRINAADNSIDCITEASQDLSAAVSEYMSYLEEIQGN